MPELESVKHEEIGVNSKGMSSYFWALWSVVNSDVVTYYRPFDSRGIPCKKQSSAHKLQTSIVNQGDLVFWF